jgi:hypothetical protein
MARPHLQRPRWRGDEQYAAADRDNRGCKIGKVRQNVVRVSSRGHIGTVIASEAKQSIGTQSKTGLLRRYAPRNDGETIFL